MAPTIIRLVARRIHVTVREIGAGTDGTSRGRCSGEEKRRREEGKGWRILGKMDGPRDRAVETLRGATSH